MRWRRIALISLGVASLMLYGCVNAFLPAVPNRVTGAVAYPPVLGAFEGAPAVASAQEWTERRAPVLRAAFETHVYGALPPPRPPDVVARAVVAESAFGGLGRVEQVTLALDADGDARMNLVLAIPRDASGSASGPAPIVLVQDFCGNHVAFRGLAGVDPPLSSYPGLCDSAWAKPIITFVFGRYANGPPLRELLARGYAAGVMYAGDFVPDAQGPGVATLERLAAPEGARWGAIAAWAWAFSRAIDYVETDPRFDPAREAVWGHSRNGKSALVAAAWDPRIDLVIAHQSGAGGATLSRSHAGESVAQITESYPHWFTPAYADYAGRENAIPVDQHQLLALVSPRPVLLGNAARDQWSDPAGAFRAAMAADEVYELLGSEGLEQSGMREWDMSADLAFFLRPGRHGVTTEDWRLFLAFLDAHFGAEGS